MLTRTKLGPRHKMRAVRDSVWLHSGKQAQFAREGERALHTTMDQFGVQRFLGALLTAELRQQDGQGIQGEEEFASQ